MLQLNKKKAQYEYQSKMVRYFTNLDFQVIPLIIKH